jgi:hypothetical protein
MGPRYAGILGLVAFCVVVVRGIGHGASASGTMPLAAAGLFVFAVIGYVLGRIAEQTVESALQAHFAAEMAKLARVDDELQADGR